MKYTIKYIFCFVLIGLYSCKETSSESSLRSYFTSTESGIKTGGVKVIPIETPKGKFNVWTKTIGNNPTTRLLLLNGGPGMTHEYFECFESFLPAEGIRLSIMISWVADFQTIQRIHPCGICPDM